jgi:hypothetical protein
MSCMRMPVGAGLGRRPVIDVGSTNWRFFSMCARSLLSGRS